jgi:hypothetical protein
MLDEVQQQSEMHFISPGLNGQVLPKDAQLLLLVELSMITTARSLLPGL